MSRVDGRDFSLRPSQNRAYSITAHGSSNKFTNWSSRSNYNLAISDNRFSFVNNLFSDSVFGNCFPSTIHLFVNPFPPSALPDFNGTMS